MAYQPRITDSAKSLHEKMFPGYESDLLQTDPEFIERFDNFAFNEVVNTVGISTHFECAGCPRSRNRAIDMPVRGLFYGGFAEPLI